MYHLILVSKYKRRVLSDAIADRMSELFYECADLNRWKIEQLNIQVDHVHILIRMRPEVSIS